MLIAPTADIDAATTRFPFHADTPEDVPRINAAIGKVLEGVEDMLYKLAFKHIRQWSADRDEVEEVVQRTRIQLWNYSLPKFDTSRCEKVTTFIYSCADRFIRSESRHRQRASLPTSRSQRLKFFGDGAPPLIRAAGPDTRLDNRIEQIADKVRENPGLYLTGAQVEVFNAMIHSPGVLMKDLAKRLGYQRASCLSMMMRRIRERIAAIDIEDFEPPTDVKPHKMNGHSLRRYTNIPAAKDGEYIAA